MKYRVKAQQEKTVSNFTLKCLYSLLILTFRLRCSIWILILVEKGAAKSRNTLKLEILPVAELTSYYFFAAN